MGNIIPSPSEGLMAWTGGEPLPDWFGLKDPNLTPEHSTQYRPFSGQKGQMYCHRGLESTFQKGKDLYTFQKDTWLQLKMHGMDAITHLLDPGDPTRMLDVINNHARFSLTLAKESHANLHQHFDKYDKVNNQDAVQFLLNSISEDMRNTLLHKINNDTGFVIIWLMVIQQIQINSMEHFQHLIKKNIKGCKATDYPGQNLQSLATAFLDDTKQLEVAGHYDHNLMMDMVKIFMSAGSDDEFGQDFCHPLQDYKEKLSVALLEIAYMEKDDANKHMEKKGLTFKDVCNVIEACYLTTKDHDEWSPACNAADAKCTP